MKNSDECPNHNLFSRKSNTDISDRNTFSGMKTIIDFKEVKYN